MEKGAAGRVCEVARKPDGELEEREWCEVTRDAVFSKSCLAQAKGRLRLGGSRLACSRGVAHCCSRADRLQLTEPLPTSPPKTIWDG